MPRSSSRDGGKVGNAKHFPRRQRRRRFHGPGFAGTLPAFGNPVHCAAARSYTTGVQDTHKTYTREVAYRWHPWYGRTVWVRGEARRGGGVVLRCVRDELGWSSSLEIPEWMFDAGFCSGMKPESLAYVSSSALLSLRELLTPGTDRIEACVVQAQHHSSNSGGADADNIPIQSAAGRTVHSTDARAAATAGSLSADAALVGTDDERTPREGSSSPHASRGGR